MPHSSTIKTVIVIPARYASQRLPGKPLVMIAGQTLLERVVRIALQVQSLRPDTQILVATDDERIVDHVRQLKLSSTLQADFPHASFKSVESVMTSVDCKTGTDRVEAALKSVQHLKADFVINLQGDTPLTPPEFLVQMIESFELKTTDVVTLVSQLSWDQLDQLREQKKLTPHSGTTVVMDSVTHQARWFSKTILPAIRQESQLRSSQLLSPVFRHIGVYGYSRAMLSRYSTLPETAYERYEGLEQLRVLENGYEIRCVPVDFKGRPSMSGVDSPEDVIRVERLLAAATTTTAAITTTTTTTKMI
jgi:3-deoxy-manno-octulosonate cytidylyltransferase (CMP-KDO synthetase)